MLDVMFDLLASKQVGGNLFLIPDQQQPPPTTLL
jgi:hypothetical protein